MTSTKDDRLQKLSREFKSKIITKQDTLSLHEYVLKKIKSIGKDEKKNSKLVRKLSLIIAGGLSFKQFEKEGILLLILKCCSL